MSHFVRESVAAYGATLRPMTVQEYYRAADAGVFKEGERLELIRGEVVVQLSPQKNPHAWATHYLEEFLRKTFPRADVRAQYPLALDAHNEPEPDVLVAKGPASRYKKRHPDARDALLVVEVADVSLKKDRELKAALYAAFEIPEYWLLNLRGGRLEIYREPRRGEDGRAFYAVSEIVKRDAKATPQLGNGREVTVSELLPD